ncbi:MAG: pitrilysin family protein [Planctomycetaceae bacterium]
MTSDNIETFQLSNGLELVVQQMNDVQSAALTLMVPAGSVYDPPGKSGVAAILAEMFPRGAGELSARELSSAMDNFGLQRSVSSGTLHVTFSAATTADRILQAIPLIASMVRQPHLDELQFPPARELVVQGLQAEEDEPRQRLGRYLRKCAYPAPWSNASDGTLDDISNIALVDVQRHFDLLVRPNSAILGIAGNVNSVEVLTAVQAAFGDWERGVAASLTRGTIHESPYHIPHDSAQTHIGLAWPTVPYSHDRYFEGWAAVSVLSGGMSSRLFTEVREKRGLCYAVSASINTLKDEARVFAYAGTTNERAQETLDVTVAEIRRLHEGLSDDELRRCKARAKSTLIMQQESTMARSGALARDTFHLGRVMLLNEIHQRIDDLTTEQVRNFAIDYAPATMALVTIGPQPLDAACVQAPAAVA